MFSLNNFDEITKFRLINAFIFAVGFNLFLPVLLDLKGEYLVAWVISSFLILEQLSVKTNRYFVKFSISTLYRLGIVVHIIFVVSACFYFINPLYMIYIESLLAIFVSMIFGAYSIKLNTLLAEKCPELMNEFQIVRNSVWADGILIGLAFTTFITYFFPTSYAIVTFIIYNSSFILYMIKNWNFYSSRNL